MQSLLNPLPTFEIPKKGAGDLDRLIHSFFVFPEEMRSRERNSVLSSPMLSQCGSVSLVSSQGPSSPLYLHPNALVASNNSLPYVMPQIAQKPVSSPISDYPSGSGSENDQINTESDDEEQEKRTISIGDSKSYINAMWIKHYEELKRFKQKHYHTNVTRTKLESRRLGNWVAEQRRKKKQGRLNKTQIDLLTAAGFEWEKRKKKKEESQPSSPSLSEVKHDKSSAEDVQALINLSN